VSDGSAQASSAVASHRVSSRTGSAALGSRVGSGSRAGPGSRAGSGSRAVSGSSRVLSGARSGSTGRPEIQLLQSGISSGTGKRPPPDSSTSMLPHKGTTLDVDIQPSRSGSQVVFICLKTFTKFYFRTSVFLHAQVVNQTAFIVS